ncbi:MAG: phosphoenolpyruvate--protein phosphotransferase [Candidatus Aminicenantes bacterium]|nr:phosphoenolpyruvate--protein phosphotransferase [Candidatus Aminicenantes bacterium]
MIILRGKSAVAGIGIGRARFLRRPARIVQANIVRGEEQSQIKRLEEAIVKTRTELEEIKDEIKEKVGDEQALILESQLLILEDKKLIEEMISRIVDNLETAEKAIEALINKYHGIFKNVEDYHIKEKIHDIEDVLRRIQKNLSAEGEEISWEGDILVAKNILPSEAAYIISRKEPEGIVTEYGGDTYHAVILARAFGIPTVVGIEDVENKIKEGEEVIVDGDEGLVILSPSSLQKNTYMHLKQTFVEEEKVFSRALDEKSSTLDGVDFKMFINLEFPSEAEKVPADKIEGVGLYRTEYLILGSQKVPNEEKQFEIYSSLAEKFKEITIRLFDLGAEKKIKGLHFYHEENPAMGERGIRYLFSHKEILYTQLRAILRASADHPSIRIMIPMVTNLDEIKKLYLVVEDIKSTLRMEGYKFQENIPVGIMVEVPAIAVSIDKIIKYVDFVSIGTNDLSQYVFAADRTNERVSYICNTLDPGFLRMVRFVIKKSAEAGKRVSVCGEMASSPLHAAVLLGLGLREFSTTPAMLPRIKRLLISVEEAVMKKKVTNALRFHTAQEVEEYLLREINKIYPEIHRCIRRVSYEKNRKAMGI